MLSLVATIGPSHAASATIDDATIHEDHPPPVPRGAVPLAGDHLRGEQGRPLAIPLPDFSATELLMGSGLMDGSVLAGAGPQTGPSRPPSQDFDLWSTPRGEDDQHRRDDDHHHEESLSSLGFVTPASSVTHSPRSDVAPGNSDDPSVSDGPAGVNARFLFAQIGAADAFALQEETVRALAENQAPLQEERTPAGRAAQETAYNYSGPSSPRAPLLMDSDDVHVARLRSLLAEDKAPEETAGVAHNNGASSPRRVPSVASSRARSHSVVSGDLPISEGQEQAAQDMGTSGKEEEGAAHGDEGGDGGGRREDLQKFDIDVDVSHSGRGSSSPPTSSPPADDIMAAMMWAAEMNMWGVGGGEEEPARTAVHEARGSHDSGRDLPFDVDGAVEEVLSAMRPLTGRGHGEDGRTSPTPTSISSYRTGSVGAALQVRDAAGAVGASAAQEQHIVSAPAVEKELSAAEQEVRQASSKSKSSSEEADGASGEPKGVPREFAWSEDDHFDPHRGFYDDLGKEIFSTTDQSHPQESNLVSEGTGADREETPVEEQSKSSCGTAGGEEPALLRVRRGSLEFGTSDVRSTAVLSCSENDGQNAVDVVEEPAPVVDHMLPDSTVVQMEALLPYHAADVASATTANGLTGQTEHEDGAGEFFSDEHRREKNSTAAAPAGHEVDLTALAVGEPDEDHEDLSTVVHEPAVDEQPVVDHMLPDNTPVQMEALLPYLGDAADAASSITANTGLNLRFLSYLNGARRLLSETIPLGATVIRGPAAESMAMRLFPVLVGVGEEPQENIFALSDLKGNEVWSAELKNICVRLGRIIMFLQERTAPKLMRNICVRLGSIGLFCKNIVARTLKSICLRLGGIFLQERSCSRQEGRSVLCGWVARRLRGRGGGIGLKWVARRLRGRAGVDPDLCACRLNCLVCTRTGQEYREMSFHGEGEEY